MFIILYLFLFCRCQEVAKRAMHVFYVKKRTKPKDRKKCGTKGIRKVLNKKFMINATQNDIICNRCRNVYYKTKPSNSKQHVSPKRATTPEPQINPSCNKSPPSVVLQIPSTSKSHAYCLICKKPGPRLIVVPVSTWCAAFMTHEIIIPESCRWCASHIRDGYFVPESLANVPTTDTTFVNRTAILEFLKRVREYALRNEKMRIDFDNSKA